jgi:hypothetical protein
MTVNTPIPDINRKERTNYKYERTTRTWYWGKINKYAKNDRIGISFVKDEVDGEFYVATVSKVAESYTEARVHDRLLKFQEKDASMYDTAEEMHQIMRDVMSFTLETIHPVPKQAGDDDDKDPSDDIELEMGDIVRLKNSKELDGTRVELKRQTASGKWMVTPLKHGKTMLVNRNQIKVDE